MEFIVEKFAEKFKDAIEWMLRDRHGEGIKIDLRNLVVYLNYVYIT